MSSTTTPCKYVTAELESYCGVLAWTLHKEQPNGN